MRKFISPLLLFALFIQYCAALPAVNAQALCVAGQAAACMTGHHAGSGPEHLKPCCTPGHIMSCCAKPRPENPAPALPQSAPPRAESGHAVLVPQTAAVLAAATSPLQPAPFFSAGSAAGPSLQSILCIWRV